MVNFDPVSQLNQTRPDTHAETMIKAKQMKQVTENWMNRQATEKTVREAFNTVYDKSSSFSSFTQTSTSVSFTNSAVHPGFLASL